MLLVQFKIEPIVHLFRKLLLQQIQVDFIRKNKKEFIDK